tara:strand:+ start:635 stop:1003 length:369 start_codon:yes stop_codon:yes gene_type:complete
MPTEVDTQRVFDLPPIQPEVLKEIKDLNDALQIVEDQDTYIIPSEVGRRLAEYGLLNFEEDSDTMAFAAHLQDVTADQLRPRITEALGSKVFPLPQTIKARKVSRINIDDFKKLKKALTLKL